jgi:hypothetical protein
VDRTSIGRPALAVALAVGLLAGACANGSSASGSGTPSLSIGSPANGASVSEPFTLTFDSNVSLGDPSTGDHHVHVCYDGASCDSGSYQKVYSDSFDVTGLSAGKHTIEASLRNADHSAAGASDTITITVTSAAGATSSPSTGSKGYGGY